MTLLSRYLSLVKFEHTLFALPFALIALLVAAQGRPSPRVVGWILAAMVGARTAAMAFNRLADRRLDAANPRTADRHLPTGRVSAAGAGILVVLSCGLLLLAAWRLNPLCLAWSPVALAVVLGYSYTKRFTPWSHLVLGLSLAGAPVGAWMAVTGGVDHFALWLGAGVVFWVGGFDAIYGCQDVEFDRRAGLHSLAARFGVERALAISRVLHVLAVACLAAAVRRAQILGPLSLVGVGIMAALLAWEQSLVRGGDLRHIDRAFFTINSWAGVVLLAVIAADLYFV